MTMKSTLPEAPTADGDIIQGVLNNIWSFGLCMYRATKKDTNNSSTCELYYSYRLVASQRLDGKPCQMILLNLGRHFAVDKEGGKAACKTKKA